MYLEIILFILIGFAIGIVFFGFIAACHSSVEKEDNKINIECSISSENKIECEVVK